MCVCDLKATRSSIKVLLSMGDEAAVLLKAMSTSKIGHCTLSKNRWPTDKACSECCGFGKDGTKVSMRVETGRAYGEWLCEIFCRNVDGG